MKYDFDDLVIVPAETSTIYSRSQVTPKDDNGMYPLFTAPMDTVICEENLSAFRVNYIYGILPRGSHGSITQPVSGAHWLAYGLDEFLDLYLVNTVKIPANMKFHVLIDIANGHMVKLLHVVENAKNKYGDQLVLMVGNVANPLTYIKLSDAGADYVRIGIGNGNACLTTQQTGIGYPMASLIEEVYLKSCSLKNPAKIVADGGFRKYSDIIKALALGADYVMLGSILARSLESCGELLVKPSDSWAPMPIESYRKACGTLTLPGNSHATLEELMFEGKLYKRFRGMSTKEVQRAQGREEIKTSEGISTLVRVEYKLNDWVDNFDHYLRSAMSYTGKEKLKDFIGNVKVVQITENAFNRYNK